MKFDKEIYIAHIKDIDKLNEMKKLLDKIFNVVKNHIIISTDFYDPYERYLVKSILNRFEEIKYFEIGGLQDSERKIFMIFPNYYEVRDIVTEIAFIRIKGNLDGLKHKDFLGSILGLGIKRTKIGDILQHDKYADIAVKSEIKEFIIYNLEKIGRTNVLRTEIDVEDLIAVELEYESLNITVSSLRLDTIVCAIYNLSRQESAKLINSEAVKVNFEITDKMYRALNENDLISTKGYGRAIVESINGISKKGKFRITVKILV